MTGHSPFRVLALSAFFALLFFSSPSLVLADSDEHRRGNGKDRFKLVTVPAGTVINRDYFAAGETVEISGTVNGDVYAAGGKVVVDGTINGDLLAAGGAVTLSGRVAQDVRLVGGQVTISGAIGRNGTVAGGNIEMTPSGSVGGSLVAGAGHLHLAAPIQGDVKLAAGRATLSARVGGALEAMVGSLRLTSTAVVAGGVTYASREEASIDERATISGPVTRKRAPEVLPPSGEEVWAFLAGLWLTVAVANFVSTLVLGFLFLHFYPNATEVAIAQLRERPLTVFGLGFFTLIGAPLIAGLLALTMLGLPLAAVLLLWFGLLLYLGRIFVIQWAGHFLLDRLGKAHHRRTAFLAGLTLYFLLTLIPFFGELLTFLVLVAGLGTLLLTKKILYTQLRNQNIL